MVAGVEEEEEEEPQVDGRLLAATLRLVVRLHEMCYIRWVMLGCGKLPKPLKAVPTCCGCLRKPAPGLTRLSSPGL